jgi:hypothetical protein
VPITGEKVDDPALRAKRLLHPGQKGGFARGGGLQEGPGWGHLTRSPCRSFARASVAQRDGFAVPGQAGQAQSASTMTRQIQAATGVQAACRRSTTHINGTGRAGA